MIGRTISQSPRGYLIVRKFSNIMQGACQTTLRVFIYLYFLPFQIPQVLIFLDYTATRASIDRFVYSRCTVLQYMASMIRIRVYVIVLLAPFRVHMIESAALIF